jgi:hypothetical protein
MHRPGTSHDLAMTFGARGGCTSAVASFCSACHCLPTRPFAAASNAIAIAAGHRGHLTKSAEPHQLIQMVASLANDLRQRGRTMARA